MSMKGYEDIIKTHPAMKVRRDPEYNWVSPLKDVMQKRGNQCGECGMKFDYDKSYGYHCGSYRCPMGYGWG